MIDQDDMDNLGRLAQLKTQELTRQAILDLQEKEAHMDKCPWCAGPVENNVSKCRHCTSDIAWVGYQPCKPEDKHKVMLRQKEEAEAKNARDSQQVACEKCETSIKMGDVERIMMRGAGKFFCKSCAQHEINSRFTKKFVTYIVVFFALLGGTTAIWNVYLGFFLSVFIVVCLLVGLEK